MLIRLSLTLIFFKFYFSFFTLSHKLYIEIITYPNLRVGNNYDLMPISLTYSINAHFFARCAALNAEFFFYDEQLFKKIGDYFWKRNSSEKDSSIFSQKFDPIYVNNNLLGNANQFIVQRIYTNIIIYLYNILIMINFFL